LLDIWSGLWHRLLSLHWSRVRLNNLFFLLQNSILENHQNQSISILKPDLLNRLLGVQILTLENQPLTIDWNSMGLLDFLLNLKDFILS
jgi:hypothetical protein